MGKVKLKSNGVKYSQIFKYQFPMGKVKEVL